MVQKNLRLLLAAVIFVSILIAGCGTPGTGELTPSAHIKRVEVDPNPVPVGDTTTITCVIADTANADLTFTWLLPDAGKRFVETDTNQYQWRAPNRVDSFSAVVIVERPSTSFRKVQESFDLVTKEKN